MRRAHFGRSWSYLPVCRPLSEAWTPFFQPPWRGAQPKHGNKSQTKDTGWGKCISQTEIKSN